MFKPAVSTCPCDDLLQQRYKPRDLFYRLQERSLRHETFYKCFRTKGSPLLHTRALATRSTDIK